MVTRNKVNNRELQNKKQENILFIDKRRVPQSSQTYLSSEQLSASSDMRMQHNEVRYISSSFVVQSPVKQLQQSLSGSASEQQFESPVGSSLSSESNASPQKNNADNKHDYMALNRSNAPTRGMNKERDHAPENSLPSRNLDFVAKSLYLLNKRQFGNPISDLLNNCQRSSPVKVRDALLSKHKGEFKGPMPNLLSQGSNPKGSNCVSPFRPIDMGERTPTFCISQETSPTKLT